MQALRAFVFGALLCCGHSAQASLEDLITKILAASRGPQWQCSDSVEEFGLKQAVKNALNLRVQGGSELYVLDVLVYSGTDPIETVQVYSDESSPEWLKESVGEDDIGLILLINGRYIRAFTDSGKIGRGTYDRTTQHLSMNFGAREETDWESIKRQIAAFQARPLHVRQKMGYKGG